MPLLHKRVASEVSGMNCGGIQAHDDVIPLLVLFLIVVSFIQSAISESATHDSTRENERRKEGKQRGKGERKEIPSRVVRPYGDSCPPAIIYK